MLMVSLILVCSMSIIPVSAANCDIDVDANDEINIVVMGGYNVHHYKDVENAWYKQLTNYIAGKANNASNAIYGKTVNIYTVGEETDTSFEGAMVRAGEVLAKNPDLVILDYSSDMRFTGTCTDRTGTINNSKHDTMAYIEKIMLRFVEAENVPHVWQVALPYTGNKYYNHEIQTFGTARFGVKTSILVKSGAVNKLNSTDISAADNWDADGNLTEAGHTVIYKALYPDFNNKWGNTAAQTRPTLASNGVYCSGNISAYGRFRAASTAVASEGFEAQEDGSMVSTAAGDTLTFTLTGRTFGVVHDVAGADYEIKIGGANYVTIDSSTVPVYNKTGYSNTSYKVIIKASDAGVKIKGFYDSPMTIDDAAYADGTVSATVLNSSLNTDDSAQAMVVYYGDNNKLVSCTPVTMTTAQYRNTAAISAAAPQGATKAKIMIWKTKEGAIPMCDATDYIAIN